MPVRSRTRWMSWMQRRLGQVTPEELAVAAGAVFVTFVFTTLIHEPASIVTLAGILVLSIGLDYGWKRGHTGTPSQIQVG